jgi:hypothetical protein
MGQSLKSDEKIKQLSKELNDAAFYYKGGAAEAIAVSVIKFEKYASGGAYPETNKGMNEHGKKGGKYNVKRD